MVLSDPVIVREVLKEKPFAFSKGVLAEILEPIMGRGLIRALRGVEEPAQAARAGVPQGVAGPHGGSVRDCSAELTKNLDKEIAAGGASRGST